MAAPESVDPGASPSLYASLRSFWGVIVSILYTRLDLATLELEEEATRAVQLLVVIMGGLLCLGMTIFFILCLLVILSGEYLKWVLLGICIVGIIVTAALAFWARKMILNRPKFLTHTLAELKRDLEKLKPVTKTDEAPL